MAYFRLPEGVRDILPDECERLDALEARLRGKFAAAGFRFVRSAGLEYYDTYAGIRSAVGQEKMFKLTDKDGRLIVLRPDMTLACARIAATTLRAESARLFGEGGAEADAAVISFAAECLREAGLQEFIIDVGHVGFYKGLLEGSGLSEAAAEEIRGYINAKDAVNTEIALRRNGASARAQAAILALPSLFGDVSVLERAKSLTDNEMALSALSRLGEVYACLKARGAEKYVSFDLGTVKSLSYYSGIVFTGLAEGVGAPVLSGGRYDGLCGQFGRELPAVGFALGMMRVLRALEKKEGR